MKKYLNKKSAIASLLVLALLAASAFTYAWFVDEGTDEPVEIEVGVLKMNVAYDYEYPGYTWQPGDDYSIYADISNGGSIEFLAKLMLTDFTISKPRATPPVINQAGDPLVTVAPDLEYIGYAGWIVERETANVTRYEPWEYIMWFMDPATDDYYVYMRGQVGQEFSIDANLSYLADNDYAAASINFKNTFKATQYRPGAAAANFGGLDIDDLVPVNLLDPTKYGDGVDGFIYEKATAPTSNVVGGSVTPARLPIGGSKVKKLSFEDAYADFLSRGKGE